MEHLFAWFLHFTGSDNVSGREYGFWSGFGSDLGEFAIVAGLVNLARRHNCHVKGCWRVGRHPVEGTRFIVCAKHHPEGDVSHETIKERAVGSHTQGSR